ncbi:MAG: MOSC domain-containing protein [Solirubrobacteraceae bacterium]
MEHASLTALEAGLDELRGAPKASGVIELVVRRPTIDQREVVEEAVLDVEQGLLGDNWRVKPWSKTGAPNPDAQLTLMSARAAAMVAGARERWPLAGDQLFVEFDLSADNIPPGTALAVGTAEIEITAEPHLGCRKFIKRFGVDAQKFVNSVDGRALNARGVNARIVRGGTVRPGDAITKL